MRKQALVVLVAITLIATLTAGVLGFVIIPGSSTANVPLALAATPSQLELAKKADAAAASGVKTAEADLAAQRATKTATGEVVVSLEAAEPPPPPPPTGQLDGTNVWPLDHGSDAEHEHEAVLAAEHHSTLVRVSTIWADLEPSKGTLNTEWFAHLDRQVNTAVARGEKAILTVVVPPGWANSNLGWQHAPNSPADYGAFCGRLSERYGSKAILEVWNEPNAGAAVLIPPSGKTQEQSYGELVKACVTGVAGRELVLAGALSYTDTEWLKRALTAGAVTLQNGVAEVSFHPYADGNPPGEGTALSTFHSFKGGIEKVHAAFPNSRLWVDEFGYKVGEAGMSETTRAQRIKESFTIVRGLSYVAGAAVYELRDKSDLFGIVNSSFVPYPALAAFTEALS